MRTPLLRLDHTMVDCSSHIACDRIPFPNHHVGDLMLDEASSSSRREFVRNSLIATSALVLPASLGACTRGAPESDAPHEGEVTPGATAANNDGTTDGDREEARREFLNTFHKACNTKLDGAAEARLLKVFEDTIGDVIQTPEGKAKYKNKKGWLLDRVKEIGRLAERTACNDLVTALGLTTAADRVILFWHRNCELAMRRGQGEAQVRFVFCERYVDNMKEVPLSSSTEA